MKAKPAIIVIALLALAICSYSFIPTGVKVNADTKVSLNSSLKTNLEQPEINPLATISVTTTADTGAGSLREAINAANQSAGNTIVFDIPNTDPGFNGKVFTIKVATQLPVINQDTTIIDGSTQTTATGNTNPSGPEIVIDGSLAPGGADGIRISSNNDAIRSVNIRNFFGGNGILITDNSRNITVTNCYIGTDETGVQAAGNLVGIRIQGGATTNTIGGSTATGNLISGNSTDGLQINGSGSDSNIVAGNVIGLDSSRNQLPNFSNGVLISGSAKNNTIGGSTADTANIISGNIANGILLTGTTTSGNRILGNFIGTVSNNAARGNGQSGVMLADGADTNTIGGGNVISFNARNGVTVGAASNSNAVIKNKITRNSISLNGGLGIDLGNDGVTNNDSGDGDSGPNLLINYPVITSVSPSGGSITVSGMVDTPTPTTATVEIFTNAIPVPGADPSGFGEGQSFAASTTPNSSGAFTVSFNSGSNVVVTATTTDAGGNTSEFSPSFQLGGGQPDLTVTPITVTPSTVNAGDMVRVTFMIRNSGTSSAAAARQDIVLSTDTTITAQDMLLTSVMSNALAPQGVQNFQVDIPIPSTVTTGRFFVGVIADAASAVTESSETNNTASAQLMVNSMPNLTVSNIKVTPATTTPGDTLRVQFTVTNDGSMSAGAHTEEVVLSTDNQLSANDIVLRSEPNSGLSVGSSTQFVLDVSLPNNTAPGTYTVFVVADARNAVAESSETDNLAMASISVSGQIDLDLTNLTLSPNSGAANTPVNVSVQLTNRGSLPVPVTAVEIRFSTDNNIDSTDTLLGTVMSKALAAGEMTTLTFSAVIPTGVTTGRRFIGVIADPQNIVKESNENNNTISSAFTIADNTAPVVIVSSPNGGETVTAGGTFMIQWTAADDVAVTSQDIFLSTDSGSTFSQVIATGLAGTATSFVWNVPANIGTDMARIQVVARDAVGNIGNDSSNSNFLIGVRPVLLNPVLAANGKFKALLSGSNIVPGATIVVITANGRETFATSLNADGTRLIVKKSTTSTPSGLTFRQAVPPGVTVQLVVRNPNGIESTPIDFQRN